MSDSYTQPSAGWPPLALVSFKTLVALVFRRKALVLALFLGVFSLAMVTTFLAPRRYESRTKILVKNERADLVVSPDARNDGQLRADVSESQVNSEIEILSSNDLLARVVRACRLYEHASGARQATGGPDPAVFEMAVRKLQHDLRITPVRKANIIQISYSAQTPELAASVLKQLSTSYLDAHLSVHRTSGTRQFFRDQAARFEARLRDTENRLSAFRRRNGLTSVVEQKELVLRKAMDAESELRESEAGLAEISTRVRELDKQVAAEEPRIVTQSRVIPNQNSVEQLNTMLAELENRRTQALMKFRSDDRVVIEVEEEIANTRAALDRASKLTSVEQATDVNPLRQSFEGDLARAELQEAGLRARRDSLAVIVKDYRARLADLENATLEHDGLQREAKESEASYLLYMNKQEEARIADALDQQKIANVAIIEAPTEQHVPVKPNVRMNLSLGFILATFVSLGAAFASQFGNCGFHTPAELEAATSFSVLATVPLEPISGASVPMRQSAANH
jgi:uncharacterized protein involved in exopolysaccharide biosynthesis